MTYCVYLSTPTGSRGLRINKENAKRSQGKVCTGVIFVTYLLAD